MHREKDANRKFGGVGIFISNVCMLTFNVRIIDQSYEGILDILLSHKGTDLHIAIFFCYLPPENSPWGGGDMEFFGHLLSQILLS